MVLRTAALLLVFLAVPCEAASRGSRIAMAVALLDVVEEHCRDMSVDSSMRDTLYRHFHEYDIGGLASAISGPLNAYYEDFLHQAKQDLGRFCTGASSLSARTGYPVILGSK